MDRGDSSGLENNERGREQKESKRGEVKKKKKSKFKVFLIFFKSIFNSVYVDYLVLNVTKVFLLLKAFD